MKKNLLLSFFLSTSMFVLGQENIFPENGGVGIGTVTPNADLHISGETSTLRMQGSADVENAVHNTIDFYSEKIGTSVDKTLGQIRGISKNSGGIYTERAAIEFKTNSGKGNYWRPPTDILFRTAANNIADSKVQMVIKDNGHIGIGTMYPDMELTVNGSIHAERVKVDTAVPEVPDYVFAMDYDLKSLNEVETYIKKNKHLPEVPSASEYAEEGVDLLEMNMLLLKKIEELTLYAIQQQRELDLIKAQIEYKKCPKP